MTTKPNITWIFIALTFGLPHITTASAYTYDKNYWGITLQTLETPKQDVLNDVNVSVDQFAYGLGAFYMHQFPRYFHMTVGADFIYIRELNPYSESVQNTNSGETLTKNSSVSGYSLCVESGVHFSPIRSSPFRTGINLGYRYNQIQRSVLLCSDCDKQNIDVFRHSAYLQPFIGYHLTDTVYGELYYTHYFQEVGFSRGLGVRFSVYSF